MFSCSQYLDLRVVDTVDLRSTDSSVESVNKGAIIIIIILTIISISIIIIKIITETLLLYRTNHVQLFPLELVLHNDHKQLFCTNH